jgi:hypothetical protein
MGGVHYVAPSRLEPPRAFIRRLVADKWASACDLERRPRRSS